MFFDFVLPLLVLATVAWVIRGKLARMRSNRDHLSSLAASLGLSPLTTEPTAALAPEDRQRIESSALGTAALQAVLALPAAQRSVYEGRVDGVRVRMGLESEQRGRVVLTVVSAHPDQPWTLGLHMEREHRMDRVLQPGRQTRDIRTGDTEFDENVFVESTKPDLVAAMLRDPTLRHTIATLLRSEFRVTISDAGARVRVLGGEPAIGVVRPLVGLMVQVVRDLHVAQRRD